jgi:hypothetical protein
LFSNLAAIISLLSEIALFIETCVKEEEKKAQLNQLEDAFRDARTQKDTTKLSSVVNSIISNAK